MALLNGFIKLSSTLLNLSYTPDYKVTFALNYRSLSFLTSYSYKNSLEYRAAARYELDQFLLGRSFKGMYAPISVIKKNPHITPLGTDHLNFTYKKSIRLLNCTTAWANPKLTYGNSYSAVSDALFSTLGGLDTRYNKVSSKVRNFRGRRFFRLYEADSREDSLGDSYLRTYKHFSYLKLLSGLQNLSFFKNRQLTKQRVIRIKPSGGIPLLKDLSMLYLG